MSKQLIKTAIHALGGLAVRRRMTRNGLRILMYHRFQGDAAGLHVQCAHLRKYYRPVSMRQVAESYRSGRPLPPCAVAVTVDDGYRDFAVTAAPIFEAHDIPTTMFVVSDFLDGKRWLWWDIVTYALAHTRRRDVQIDGAVFCDRLKTMPHTEAEHAIALLLRELEVDLPATAPEPHAPMTWAEARSLSSRGVEFGAHTRTHPILSRVADPERLRDEVLSPKTRIESELGLPVLHFCYPNGRREDFTTAAVALVEGAFQTGVTTERGINFKGASPSTLRRLGVGPDIPLSYFAELLAGVRTE
jgi:peptidoglycan/xylan/chitin deacetylase (PgdA/CDA1 family)